ncbi:conjugal transfer protein TraB [Streptomyces sp. NPDC058739]|uniref:conjugal transfer protein TraB n=1 Tax=Streptomyces sp. NPDC058739 TaxID=3346618 RepID=UPI00368A9423
MTDLVPHPTGTAPVPADDDLRYKAVQSKLTTLGKAMDDAALELEALRRDMKADAANADTVATDIENADLDAKFVGMTHQVAEALSGAAIAVKDLGATAQEVVSLTHQASTTHSKLYGALDDLRSSRREKTPRPGFFNR